MNRIAFRPPSALWFVVAFVLLGVIVYLSIARTVPQIPGDEGGRYGHVAAYAALMFMFARIYATNRWRAVIGLTLLGIGVTLEFVQAASGYRSFEYGDIIADAVGVTLGLLAERTFSHVGALRRVV